MSDRPPHNPDDLTLGGLVDEVVSQVRVALDEADVTSRQSRDMLLDGLRDVMQALDPGSLVRPKGAEAPDEGPDVSVVDGGRADDAPPTDGPKPDLKVAEPAADSPEPEQPRVYTRVTVHKAKPPTDGHPRLTLEEGATWRSLFRGSTARPYRLTAEQGSVRVSLDGMPADTIPAGSSLDVEASVIQVAAEGGAARVRYERLPS